VYGTGIIPSERQRVELSSIYLFRSYTGGRDNEKQPPKDGEIFGQEDDDFGDQAPDEKPRLLSDMLSQAVRNHGRPKALCYEDLLLAALRHPEPGRDVFSELMAVKLVHHKGKDRKPRPQ